MAKTLLTASLEDYLEALYEIIQEKNGVKAVDVAKRLNVKRSSVTEALKHLSKKGLINYNKYDVISLTPDGNKTAQAIIKKHKTLFEFLTNVLGIEENEASENACKMEHVISDNVLNRIIDFIESYKKGKVQEWKFCHHLENF